MRTAMIVDTSSSANMAHTTRLCLPVKYGPLMRQNWRPHSVVRPIRTRTTTRHGAVIANAASTHTVESRSSRLQSIEDLKVPVFTSRHLPPAGAGLRRSYRRSVVAVVDTPGPNLEGPLGCVLGERDEATPFLRTLR